MQQSTIDDENAEASGIGALLGRLNQTEYRVLADLSTRMPKGQSHFVVKNSEIAQSVGLSIRTIQVVYKRLVDYGILQRKPFDATDPFSMMQTVFGSPGMAEMIRQELSASGSVDAGALKLKRKLRRSASPRKQRTCSDLTVPTDRFPFRSLRHPSRFREVPNCLEAAIVDSERYWDWLAAAVGSGTLDLKLESQKRKMRDGKRSGLIKVKHRELKLVAGVAERIGSYARECHRNELEGTFGMCSTYHPVLLVDDVSEEALWLLPAASAILETSPGCFQVTLVAPKLLTRQERLFAQRALIDLVDGDRGANNASQLRRFPGSVNNKAELHCAFVTRVCRVPVRLTLENREVEALIAQGAAAYRQYESSNQQQVVKSSASPAPTDSDQSIKSRDRSASARDFGRVIAQVRAGVPDKDIFDALVISAGRRKKSGALPGSGVHRAYADRTLRNARDRLNKVS